jgi:ribosomal protein RSM22 (predicted rRNA methylase)
VLIYGSKSLTYLEKERKKKGKKKERKRMCKKKKYKGLSDPTTLSQAEFRPFTPFRH